MFHDGIDVRIVSEESAVAEANRAKHEPGLEAAQESELCGKSAVGQCRYFGNSDANGCESDQRCSGCNGKCCAPGYRPGEKTRQRNAREIRDGHARDHQTHVS